LTFRDQLVLISAMAGFDKNIVREYFELNGFLTAQLRKYSVRSRKNPAEDVVDLIVHNPAAPETGPEPNFQLFSSDMALIRQAVVVVHRWQHTRVTPAMLKSSVRLLEFLKKDVLNQVEALFDFEGVELPNDLVENPGKYRKILVLPGLPTAEPQRSECIALFKENGVDGVIAFRTILENLLRKVEVNHSYSKSELLQLLRVLKIYNMTQEPELSLFD
jgi:hypothetical protein